MHLGSEPSGVQAARIDGCGEFGIYWRVVLPIIKPALASLAIFIFLSTWNDFLGPLVYLRSPDNFTIQLWLSVVSRQANLFQPHLVMAGSVLSSIPILIVFATLHTNQRVAKGKLVAGTRVIPLTIDEASIARVEANAAMCHNDSLTQFTSAGSSSPLRRPFTTRR